MFLLEAKLDPNLNTLKSQDGSVTPDIANLLTHLSTQVSQLASRLSSLEQIIRTDNWTTVTSKRSHKHHG